jgi:hypothetical protein
VLAGDPQGKGRLDVGRPQDAGAEQGGGHAELGRGGPGRWPGGLGPEPPQGAPAQRGDLGHPQGGHRGHGHGGDQQGDQEPDRAPVGRPGGHPDRPQHRQGREPQPGGPVPGPLLGSGRQAAQAQPLPDRGHRRLAPERRLHLGQRPVRLGGDQLVGGPLDRVGTGRRGRPHSQTDPPPAPAGAGQDAVPEQAGDGGGGDQRAPAVEEGGLMGSRRAGTAAPASARRLARPTTATVTANRAT